VDLISALNSGLIARAPRQHPRVFENTSPNRSRHVSENDPTQQGGARPQTPLPNGSAGTVMLSSASAGGSGSGTGRGSGRSGGLPGRASHTA